LDHPIYVDCHITGGFGHVGAILCSKLVHSQAKKGGIEGGFRWGYKLVTHPMLLGTLILESESTILDLPFMATIFGSVFMNLSKLCYKK
jgi:hypothetical protein